jgi:hypothetical protein
LRAAISAGLARRRPAAVALVEDQVDDREHRREAVEEEMSRRHAKRDPGGLDLALPKGSVLAAGATSLAHGISVRN